MKLSTTAIGRKEIGPVATFILYAVLAIFTLMTLFPLIWLAFNSLKTTQEFYVNNIGFPQNVTWNNFPAAWRIGQFGSLFINSIIYTVASTAGIMFLSVSAGFAFAKLKSKWTPFLYGSFIIGILLTVQSIMVPLFLAVRAVGLYNTRLGVLIPYIGIGMPIGVYLCTQFIKGIPDSVLESARIDGASFFKIFGWIIVPMTKPVLMTLAILTVTTVWNEFMLVNILVSSQRLRSLPVGIHIFSGALGSDYGRQFAALVIGLLPMVLFYLIFRNQITRGVSAGAVKG